MIFELLTNAFGGPLREFESRRYGPNRRFTIAANLIWRWETFMSGPRAGRRWRPGKAPLGRL